MATSSLAVTSKKFKEFLDDKFIFGAFSYFIAEQRGFSLDYFLANTPPVDYISTAFDWHETSEGFEYWRKVNMEWLRELKK